MTAYNETAFKNSHCRTSPPQERSEQILHVSQAIKTAEVTAGGCTLSLPVTVTFCHRFITDFFPPPAEVEEAEPRPSNPSSRSSPSPSAHRAAAPLLQCVKGLGWCQPSKGILVSATNSPERLSPPGGAEVREALKARVQDPGPHLLAHQHLLAKLFPHSRSLAGSPHPLQHSDIQARVEGHCFDVLIYAAFV